MSKEISADEFAILVTSEATVSHVRTWDPHIYFNCSDGARGWYYNDDWRICAIAAAAQAANRNVYIQYSGYDPSGHRGSGTLTTVKLSLEPF